MIRAAVLGKDVSASRSPQIHNAAYAALGIDGKYEARSVAGSDFRKTVMSLIKDGYNYVNVTIPHKKLAANIATRRSAAVEMTGAANTLVFRRNAGTVQITADNTDGQGLLAALADLGVTIKRGTRVVMVGAGGAAAGALLALVKSGAVVVMLARRVAAARALKNRLPQGLRKRVQVAGLKGDALASQLPDAHVLISAVPAVAWEETSLVQALQALPKTAAVVEMAYGSVSALAIAARRRTPRYQDGLPMLVHQAAFALKLALRKAPPVEPLFRAARRKPPERA